MQSNIHQPDRRAVLTGTVATAAAVAATALPAVAESNPSLAELIEAHKVANHRFCEACEREETASNAYRDTYPREIVVPLSIGGGVSLYSSSNMDHEREEARQRIRKAYDEAVSHLRQLSRIDEAMAQDATAKLRAMERRDARRLGRMVRDETARQEAFGWQQAERERAAASLAEDEAELAILRYHCRTAEEAKMRHAYIMTPGRENVGHIIYHSLIGGGEEFLDALLASTVPA